MSGKPDKTQKRKPSSDPAKRAKGDRFALTANILTGKSDLRCHIENKGPGSFPAYTDKVNIHINEDCPPVKDAVYGYTLDKAKNLHECGHIMYTGHDDYRKKLAEKANSKKTFYDISNILEDGRIEAKLREEFGNAHKYLDLIGSEFVESAKKMEIMDLAIRVRFGHYVSDKGKAKWTPHEDQITKALGSEDTRGVCEAALEITNRLVKHKQDEEEEEGDGEGGKKKKGYGKCHPTEAEGAPEVDDDDDDSDEEDRDSDPREMSKEDAKNVKQVQKKIEDMKKEIYKEVRLEAEDELKVIECTPIPAETQQYQTDEEEQAAIEIADIINSFKVDATRQHFEHSRKVGMVDNRRLVAATTGGHALKFRTNDEDFDFSCGIALDGSGSTGAKTSTGKTILATAQAAARILNGACQLSDTKSQVCVFNSGYGHENQMYPQVPVDDLRSSGGGSSSTAIDAVSKILSEGTAKRRLIILLNDGTSDIQTPTSIKAARDRGCYIVAIGIEGSVESELRDQCDKLIMLKRNSDLPGVMSEALLDFALSS